MAGLTNAEAAATLDARFPTSGATDYVAYSANGSTETGSLARTAVGATGWAAATVADPSVKANANTLTTAAASADVTLTHYRIEQSDGTARTDWTELAAPKSLLAGQTTAWDAGALWVTLT